MHLARSAFLISLGLMSATCGRSPADPSTEPISISSSVTFLGYCAPTPAACSSRLDLSPREVVLTGGGRGGRRRALAPDEWARLAGAVDRARLQALPRVLECPCRVTRGCPDCGIALACPGCGVGQESLTVAFANGQSSTVTFEYNHDVPGLETLLRAVRALRESLVSTQAAASPAKRAPDA